MYPQELSGEVAHVQTLEMVFTDTITKYSYFTEAASLLTQEIPSLTPIEIQNRCITLMTLQREMTATSNQLCLIMESMGPEILDTSYAGALQRAIDKSVFVCAPLSAEILVYRDKLHILP